MMVPWLITIVGGYFGYKTLDSRAGVGVLAKKVANDIERLLNVQIPTHTRQDASASWVPTPCQQNTQKLTQLANQAVQLHKEFLAAVQPFAGQGDNAMSRIGIWLTAEEAVPVLRQFETRAADIGRGIEAACSTVGKLTTGQYKRPDKNDPFAKLIYIGAGLGFGYLAVRAYEAYAKHNQYYKHPPGYARR
jgi:hypothetical protein